ncbi:MAG: NblA/ycf18 family protein [Cyanobacteria bacterium P01_D01_bin.123]
MPYFEDSEGGIVAILGEIMNSPGTLKMEQEFRLQMLKTAAQSANHDQLVELLLVLAQQLMLKDNWIQHMFRECYIPDSKSMGTQ